MVAGLTYSQAKDILSDPILFSVVDTARIAAFLAEATGRLLVRVGLALMFEYGRLGGEVSAQLYAAVAEELAWVYRVHH